MNIERHNAIIARIEADPSCWKQSSWHCGTSHCYGGWAQIESGKPANDSTARGDAREWLDLNRYEAEYAFAGNRTLAELKALPERFNLAGYDRAGYNRDGYDRDGRDRAGYDRDGFDRYGLDRDGRDRAGYDLDGRDRAGYDRAGYDRDGLDKNNKRKPV
jgi:hypothetical protein